LIRNIGVRSANGAGGGFYVQRNEFWTFENCSVWGFTGGYGWLFDGTTGDCNYHHMLNCRVGKCLYGVRFNGPSSAKMIDCKINGNNGGNDNIIPGSRGIWSNGANANTYGCYVQGFDTLIYQDDDFLSQHFGIALEDFTSYGIHIAGALGAGGNRGLTAHVQAINNFLTNFREPANCASSRSIYLSDANIGNVRIIVGHCNSNLPPQYNNGGVMTDIPFRQAAYFGTNWVDWNPN
jgi:hypothetical protein